MHKILVVAEASPVSEQALLEALKIAKIYQSIVLCVHPVPPQNILNAQVAQEIKRVFEEVVKSTGLEFEWHMVEGKPGPAVVSAASTMNVDLVVIGSLGEEGIKRQVVESPVEHVVRHAPCDVLVVKKERPIF